MEFTLNRRSFLGGMSLLTGIGCRTDDRAPSSVDPASFSFDAAAPGLDRGQQSPPLPPNLDIWSWDAGGFVASPQWYGEHDWDGVRMRLMGHLVWMGRDRARASAARGNLEAVAQCLVETRQDLDRAAPRAAQGVAAELFATLRAIVDRDTAVVRAVQAGEALEGTDAAAVLSQWLSGKASPEPPWATPPDALDLDRFANFDERHQLRVRQWAAWGQVTHPFGLVPTFGYFDARAWTAHAAALAQHRGVSDWRALAGTQAPAPIPVRAADLAALPTGDSLIDTVGAPGPRAIGTLWMMGTDDAAWMAWLAEHEAHLNRALERGPAPFVDHLHHMLDAVDRHTHGSRYYNRKQLRNTGIRCLASRGHWTEARQLVAEQWPLHFQDWACPNRAGILTAIDAHLALCAGGPDTVSALDSARATSLDFLASVANAEAQPQQGPPKNGPPSNGQTHSPKDRRGPQTYGPQTYGPQTNGPQTNGPQTNGPPPRR